MTTEIINILTVDDHPILRDGLAAMLSPQADMALVGEASNGHEAIELHRRLRPEITLMDLQMPGLDGVETIKAIRQECPVARIIVLTTYAGDAYAIRAIKAGAMGYLLKSSVRRELLETIRAVHGGIRRIPPHIANEIAFNLARDDLSEREVAVLSLVAAGNSNKEIALNLSVSEDTVKAHMKSIFAKLEAGDRAHALAIGIRRGIIAI